jgi:hypothetical protein
MHALRHFYASVLIDAGESVKAVAEYLGHADPGFTHCDGFTRSMDSRLGVLRTVAGTRNAGRSTEVSRPASHGPVTARGPF